MEFDAQERNKMSKPLEGQLYKYTNVVKGYQYRWFILLPDSGILEYYMLDEVKKKRPRGAIYLAGAVISPSDEDSQSFTISAACGELYKLKANDAKERQFWVNRIRAVAERHTNTIAEKNPPLPPREFLGPMVSRTHSFKNGDTSSVSLARGSISYHDDSKNQVKRTASSVAEALSAVRDMLQQTDSRLQDLTRSIELLPHTGIGPKCCDTDLLLLKASSAATLKSLQQCYTILQHQQVAINFPKAMIAKKASIASSNTSSKVPTEKSTFYLPCDSSSKADPSGEVPDQEDIPEREICLNTEQHAQALNLMSQLKLGSDLTKVVLPSFILEPRSLLEMFADFMRHPDLFIRIEQQPSAEARMLAVLEWYLTSFHAAREVLCSRKPYNPVLGETFHCSWKVPRKEEEKNSQQTGDIDRLTFVAEQVLHHPPVSAFYVECKERNMAMNGHISVKSNFLTSHIGVTFIGEVKLHLLNLREVYLFTFPTAYIRNLLTMPWIELGGRVTVTCAVTNLSAFITFMTKPHASATPHQISGEVRYGEDLIHRISGEWNSVITFTPVDESKALKVIEVAQLVRHKKYIRPLNEQDAFESRKLWLNVTRALQREDYAKADEEKKKIETEQRLEEQKRVESGQEYHGKLFHMVDGFWRYKYPLQAETNI